MKQNEKYQYLQIHHKYKVVDTIILHLMVQTEKSLK